MPLDTAYRDLANLVELRILEKTGKGRGTKYILSHERK